jgi:hypothetical protein
MRLLEVRFNYLFKLPYGLPYEGLYGSPATDHLKQVNQDLPLEWKRRRMGTLKSNTRNS